MLELFLRAYLQDLESVDIKHTDDGLLATLAGVNVLIDLLHHIAEEAIKGGFGQGITGEGGLLVVDRGGYIPASLGVVTNGSLSQGLFQELWLHLEVLGRSGHLVLGGHVGAICSAEFHVSEVEDSGNHVEDSLDLGLLESDSLHGDLHFTEFLLVIEVLDGVGIALVGIVVIRGFPRKIVLFWGENGNNKGSAGEHEVKKEKKRWYCGPLRAGACKRCGSSSLLSSGSQLLTYDGE